MMSPGPEPAGSAGRFWTVRLTGHGDRTATVVCSTAACRMPPRSKDLASLRAFAARHAGAHAKAATPRPNAACHCRAERCAAHEDVRAHCAGAMVFILRHDPCIGRVWSVEEVCTACASLIRHAQIIARSRPPKSGASRGPVAAIPAPAPSTVSGGFSSPSPPTDGASPARRRSRSRPGPPHGGRLS